MRAILGIYWFFAIITGLLLLIFLPGLVLDFRNYVLPGGNASLRSFWFARMVIPFLFTFLILNCLFLTKNNSNAKWFIRISLIILTILVTTGIFVGIFSYWGGFSGGGVNQLIAFAIASPFLGLLVTTVVVSIGDLSVNNKNLI